MHSVDLSIHVCACVCACVRDLESACVRAESVRMNAFVRVTNLVRANPHYEILSVCLRIGWPLLVVFVSQGSAKLDNYHCVRTNCVGLTLLNCYPTFLLRKKELEQARQLYLFAREKT